MEAKATYRSIPDSPRYHRANGGGCRENVVELSPRGEKSIPGVSFQAVGFGCFSGKGLVSLVDLLV